MPLLEQIVTKIMICISYQNSERHQKKLLEMFSYLTIDQTELFPPFFIFNQFVTRTFTGQKSGRLPFP